MSGAASSGALGMGWYRLSAIAAGIAVVATAAPLFTYTISLALFGLPHVVGELRYLRARYGPWALTVGWTAVACLGLVMLGRLLAWLGALPSGAQPVSELLLAAVVVAVSITATPGRCRWLVGTTALILFVGAAWWPIALMLIVAVSHNWTPVPLLLGDFTGSGRWRFVAFSIVFFALVPAAIATGGPWHLLHTFGASWPEFSVLHAGTLTSNLPAYLPRSWLTAPWAQHVFTAIVFAQCMHYLMVLDVMPRLGTIGAMSMLRWVGVGVMGIVVLAAFAVDFKWGRGLYGSLSAVHAWVEVPMLLALLCGRLTPAPTAHLSSAA